MVVTVKLNTRHYQTARLGKIAKTHREKGKIQFFLANHKQINFFNTCSMELLFRRNQGKLLKKMYENTPL